MFIEWTEIGTYHMEQGKGNEDVITSLESDKASVIVLCDGVSACENSEKGAQVSGKSLSKFMMHKKDKLADYDEATIARIVVKHILYDLTKTAEAGGITTESLSSTAACVLYDGEREKLLCINIGDALIGGVSSRGVEILVEPRVGTRGCYATTTRGVEYMTSVQLADARNFHSVFICSDGAWKQFYEGGRIDNDIKKYFDINDFKQVIRMIKEHRSFDDRSMVVMDLTGRRG